MYNMIFIIFINRPVSFRIFCFYQNNMNLCLNEHFFSHLNEILFISPFLSIEMNELVKWVEQNTNTYSGIRTQKPIHIRTHTYTHVLAIWLYGINSIVSSKRFIWKWKFTDTPIDRPSEQANRTEQFNSFAHFQCFHLESLMPLMLPSKSPIMLLLLSLLWGLLHGLLSSSSSDLRCAVAHNCITYTYASIYKYTVSVWVCEWMRLYMYIHGQYNSGVHISLAAGEWQENVEPIPACRTFSLSLSVCMIVEMDMDA